MEVFWSDLFHMVLAFIVVILYMGIVRRDNRDDYWSEGLFKDNVVTTVFPKQERFYQILFALHVRLDDDFTAEERRKDPFIKIRPFLEELCASFSAAFTPFQALSIDEQTIAFKGRHKAKQYNKQKPQKWGFKNFAVYDSRTGFLLPFKSYGGKDENRPRDMPLGDYVVQNVLYTALRNKRSCSCY
jgi:hypothetical protein